MHAGIHAAGAPGQSQFRSSGRGQLEGRSAVASTLSRLKRAGRRAQQVLEQADLQGRIRAVERLERRALQNPAHRRRGRRAPTRCARRPPRATARRSRRRVTAWPAAAADRRSIRRRPRGRPDDQEQLVGGVALAHDGLGARRSCAAPSGSRAARAARRPDSRSSSCLSSEQLVTPTLPDDTVRAEDQVLAPLDGGVEVVEGRERRRRLARRAPRRAGGAAAGGALRSAKPMAPPRSQSDR